MRAASWLLIVGSAFPALSCSSLVDAGPGDISVSVTTTGADIDPDGYAVSVDGGTPQPLAANDTVTILELSAGEHTVTLTGAAINCPIAGSGSRTLRVASRATAAVEFTVTCAPLVGTVRVVVATTGPDRDADGYSVTVDGDSGRPIAAFGTLDIPDLAVDTHAIALDAVASNCSVGGPNPRSAFVAFGATTTITFTVTCLAITGTVLVTTATTGVDLDPDGYAVSVDGGTERPIGVAGALLFPGLRPDTHTVLLTGLAANCRVDPPNPRTVIVAAGRTDSVAFAVVCNSLTAGALRVTAVTTGLDLDPNGYLVFIDGDGYYPWHVPANGTITIPTTAGTHTVELGGEAPNCTRSGAAVRTVEVIAGDTAEVTFDVLCVALGSIQVSVTTSGIDLDPNGYLVFVDGEGYYPWHVPANGTITIRATADTHTVELGGVAPNCTVNGAAVRTVDVTAGDTAEVTFDVLCVALGSIQVSIATSGIDLNPNGYDVWVNGPSGFRVSHVTANDVVTIAGLFPGDYTVALASVAVNCDVAAPHPRSASVVSGGTTALAFAVACEPVTRLAFTSLLGGNSEVFVVNSNGTGAAQVTSSSAYEGSPAWSADGSRIAFRSDRDGNAEVYLMNADGSTPVRLTADPAADYDPAFSPDGLRIAFTSERDGNAEIYQMNADGTGLTRLTSTTGRDEAPDWSPDGTRIVFTSDRAGTTGIYVMNADGSGLTRLSSGPAADFQPAWSPDGTSIAFSRLVGCSYNVCDYDLYLVSADGSSVRRLTSHWAYAEVHPTWSPDGRWIAYEAQYCDPYYGCQGSGIEAVRVDGTDRVVITIGNGSVFTPAWRR